jgi:D-tyrosyl-tRNA(Tyr) deacylase
MIGLLQRVTTAAVRVDDQVIGQIGAGLLVLVGIQPTDTPESGRQLLTRILKYRIFDDEGGKMNLSLQQISGGLLLVPQFTLAADTRHGLRPGFSTAAPPDVGRRLFDGLVTLAQEQHPTVQTGQFGAHMQVSLINSGPATFWLQT